MYGVMYGVFSMWLQWDSTINIPTLELIAAFSCGVTLLDKDEIKFDLDVWETEFINVYDIGITLKCF